MRPLAWIAVVSIWIALAGCTSLLGDFTKGGEESTTDGGADAQPDRTVPPSDAKPDRPTNDSPSEGAPPDDGPSDSPASDTGNDDGSDTGADAGTDAAEAGPSCSITTCPNGCCDTTNDTCIDITHQSTTQCGKNGAACGGCSSGNTCSNGACSCGGGACPNGCCDTNGNCVSSMHDTCGLNGVACQTCNASQSCTSQGKCACDSSSCPSGCCVNGDRCVLYASQDNTTCGASGVTCGGCPSGERCNGSGHCVCDGTSCPNGCCDIYAVCQAQSTTTCGRAGSQCQQCGTGIGCDNGRCLCDSVTCPTGCCDSNLGCVQSANESTSSCGTNGNACGGCDPTVSNACTNGVCVCGSSGGPCSAGLTCCSSGCTTLSGGDANNCGSCGHPCGPGASCSNGVCQPVALVSNDSNLGGLFGLSVGGGTLYGTNYYVNANRIYAIPTNASPYAGDPPWLLADAFNEGTTKIAYDAFAQGSSSMWFGLCENGSAANGTIYSYGTGHPIPIAGPVACVNNLFSDAAGTFWSTTDANGNMTNGFQAWKRGDALVNSSVRTFLPTTPLKLFAVDSGNVYWVNGVSLQKQDIPDLFTAGPGGNGTTTMYGSPTTNVMAFDATYMYFWDGSAIQRETKGSPAPTLKVTNFTVTDAPTVMASDGKHVFWAGGTDGILWYTDTGGHGVQTQLAIARVIAVSPDAGPSLDGGVGSGGPINALTVDATYAYWTSCGTQVPPACSIWRMALP